MTRHRRTEQSLVTPLQLPQKGRTLRGVGDRLGRIGERSQVCGGQGGDNLLFSSPAESDRIGSKVKERVERGGCDWRLHLMGLCLTPALLLLLLLL